MCGRRAKTLATVHRYGEADAVRPVCGVHARVASTTGRVYEFDRHMA